MALQATRWQYVYAVLVPQAGSVALSPRLTVDGSQAPGTIYTTGWQVRAYDAETMPPGLYGPCADPLEIAAGWRPGGGAPVVVSDPPSGTTYDTAGFINSGLILTDAEGE